LRIRPLSWQAEEEAGSDKAAQAIIRDGGSQKGRMKGIL